MRVAWLSESEVAERLHTLRSDETAWSRADDEGRFSLAGAQPKIALFHDGERWGIPIGRTPTTHILKPPTGVFDGQLENEHFCLHLARKLGLPVASSRIMRFENETAIVVERYDRVRMTPAMAAAMAATAAEAAARAAGLAELGKRQPVLRPHQEDMCQALAVRPQSKYQHEGGPSPEQIADLLRDHSDEPSQDLNTFVGALLLSWLIGGSDGHAKNYSLLHGAGGRVRLAPLYDLASALPYPSLNTAKLKLAMKLGSHYRLRDIGATDLRKLAAGIRTNPDAVIERAREMCTRTPEAANEVAHTCRQDGLTHSIFAQLESALGQRAADCEQRLR
ncbi:MAG TPA: HipA domain-containing protein [Polyangiales bacterium]